MVKITLLILKLHRNILLLIKNLRLHNTAYAAPNFLLTPRIAAKLEFKKAI